MKKAMLFIAVGFVLTAVPAFATDVTLFGGMQRQGELTLKSLSTTETFNPKNFGVMGLRFGVGKRVFGNETTFAYSPNFIDSSAKAFILNTNILAQVPTSSASPYLTAGLGTIFTVADSRCATCVSLEGIGTKFALNYGGGLKVFKGPVGIRFDARGYLLPSIQSQKLNVLELTVGLVFRTGGN
jgi:opacity protein-like surface antigen